MNPTVSILLPTFQSEKFIRETLTNVLKQSFSDFELCIVDDASTDGTISLVQELTRDDARVRLIRNASNQGVGRTYLDFLKSAKGEFVAQIGHDDVWAPDFLEKMVAGLKARPEVSAMFSKVEIIDEASKLHVSPPDLFKHSLISELKADALFYRLIQGNFLCASSSLFRAELLKGKMPTWKTDYLQDWLTWLLLAMTGSFSFNTETSVKYRIHSANLSVKRYRSGKGFHEGRMCLAHLFGDRDLIPFLSRFHNQGSFDRFVEECLSVSDSFGFDLGNELLEWFEGRSSELRQLDSATYQKWTALIGWAAGDLKRIDSIPDWGQIQSWLQIHKIQLRTTWFFYLGGRLSSQKGRLAEAGWIQQFGGLVQFRAPRLGIFRSTYPRAYLYVNSVLYDTVLFIEKVSVSYQTNCFSNFAWNKLIKKFF